jgi:hypothetical protein
MIDPVSVESERWTKKLKRWEREPDEAATDAEITLRRLTAGDNFGEVLAMGFQACTITSRKSPLEVATNVCNL